MKTIFSQLVLISAFVCSIQLSVSAQVTPSTPNVKLFCSGASIDLGTPPANTNWEVLFSATATTTPTTPVTLTTNSITSPQTGYYYIMTKGTAAGSCISEAQEVPVYMLSPLAVDFTGFQFCPENTASVAFTGTVSSTDTNTQTFAYQWYTVVGSTETPIAGATNPNYSPSTTPTAGTVYRLKAGYSIGGNKYCSTVKDQTIDILPAPTKPTINITAPTDSW